MGDWASGHKLPQRVRRNEDTPQSLDCGERAARDQALHRPHRDPAKERRRVTDGVGQAFICHLTPAAIPRSPTRTGHRRP